MEGNWYNFSTKPSSIGHGAWLVIHRMAWNARTDETKRFFCVVLRDLINNFPCGDCKGHATNYISTNIPESYFDFRFTNSKLGFNKEDLSMFKYTVDFHNTVNKRLDKPTISLENVISAFINNQTGFCSEGCEHDDDNKNKHKPKQSLVSMLK